MLRSSTRTGYIIVKKKLVLEYFLGIWGTTWFTEGDIPLTKMLLICQISFIFILYLYDQGDDALTKILPFEAKWDEQKSI